MAIYFLKANPLTALIGQKDDNGENAVQIMQGFPKLDATQKDLTVVAQYRIPWDKIDDARKGFLGWNVISIGTNVFTQFIPYRLAFAGENVFAVKFGSVPFDVIQLNEKELKATYTYALVTVQFKPQALQRQGGLTAPLIFQESANPQPYVNLAQATDIFWDTDNKEPVDSSKFPTSKTSRIVWSLDYPDIPEMWSKWEEMEGTTNSDTINRKSLRLEFAPETLLVQDISASVGIGPDGTEQISTRFSAVFNRFTWNKFQRKVGQDPVPIYDSAGALVKPFPPVFSFSDKLPGIN